MSTNENTSAGSTGSSNNPHNSEQGETNDFTNLNFDEKTNSFELDVKGDDPDYDHPLPYETSAVNGEDFNSDYDEANPYIGDEYGSKDEQIEDGLDSLGMHVDSGESILLSPEDGLLAKTPEDERTDLDEEGYPINDAPPMP
jgi:hypothetical protein